MMKNIKKRALSVLCAAATAFSCMGGAILPIAKTFAEYFASSESEEAALCRTRFELYPNGEEAAETISLEGLAPEGASAEDAAKADGQAATRRRRGRGLRYKHNRRRRRGLPAGRGKSRFRRDIRPRYPGERRRSLAYLRRGLPRENIRFYRGKRRSELLRLGLQRLRDN